MPESLIWGVNPAFQHTAARRRLVSAFNQPFLTGWFQHTAARRRLDGGDCSVKRGDDGFNTQPPEGGWPLCFAFSTMPKPFQHTAARRRLGACEMEPRGSVMFQHTAARRRLGEVEIAQMYEQLFQHTAARRRLAIKTGTASPK